LSGEHTHLFSKIGKNQNTSTL